MASVVAPVTTVAVPAPTSTLILPFCRNEAVHFPVHFCASGPYDAGAALHFPVRPAFPTNETALFIVRVPVKPFPKQSKTCAVVEIGLVGLTRNAGAVLASLLCVIKPSSLTKLVIHRPLPASLAPVHFTKY